MAQSVDIVHPKLAELFAYWREQAGAAAMPIADELDVSALNRWIGNLVVIDVPEPGRFVYAYYGERLEEAFRTQMVGRTPDELPEAQRAALQQEYEAVRSAAGAIARRYTADFDGRLETWERLVLPLSAGDDQVVKILVAAYRIDPPNASDF